MTGLDLRISKAEEEARELRRAKMIADAPEKRRLCDLLGQNLLENKRDFDAGTISADRYQIRKRYNEGWLRRFQDEILEASGKPYTPECLRRKSAPGDNPPDADCDSRY